MTHFDGMARSYDAAYDARGAPGRALRDRLATVLELAGDGPGDALDAGMGPGRLVVELERRGWHVSGVDASPEMVALARKRVPGAAERLIVGTLEALPFPDARFALVVATGVLEYARDLETALAELARVVRPGGRAVVTLPNWWSASTLVRRLVLYPVARRLGRPAPPPPPRLIRPSELESLLRGAGLVPTATRPTSFRPVRLPGFAAQVVLAAERP